MSWKSWNLIINILIGSMILFISVIIFTGLMFDNTSKEYITNVKVDCEDKNGNLISNQTCYKKIDCSDSIRIWNVDLCDIYIKQDAFQEIGKK